MSMKSYYDLCDMVLHHGFQVENDRTGTGTLSLFGPQIEFDLKEGFPLLTGKYTPFKLVAAELLWFLSGSANNEDLRKLNRNDKPTIWEEWARVDGSLGPIYGKQWRKWHSRKLIANSYMGDVALDQIQALIEGLRTRPRSRRHVVSAWNVADLPDESLSPQENVVEGKMALAPCHMMFQLYCRELLQYERVDALGLTCQQTLAGAQTPEQVHTLLDKLDAPRYALSCKMYQRSADLFLGVPFNIASYALLTHLIAQVTNMVPEELIISFGDVHVYKNHIKQMEELLARQRVAPRLPTLTLNQNVRQIDDFTMADMKVDDYLFLSAINAPVSI